MDAITQWIIPLLLYSGPTLPLAISVLFGANQALNRPVIVTSLLHLLAWLPFIYTVWFAEYTDYLLLLLPALTGLLSFVIVSLIILLKQRNMDAG